VILACNFEELRALATGAEIVTSESRDGYEGPVVAPPEALAHVESLQPRLNASLSIETLADQRAVRSAVDLICNSLHSRLEDKVLEHHPAHEEAVNLYFDYAHTYAVLDRLDEMGAEMNAIIEVMTGQPVTGEAASSIAFPD
jgi:hypothetical protein